MELRTKFDEELSKHGDPRVLGFDSYPRISTMREFEGFHKRGEYNPVYLQEEQKLIK